MADAFDSPFRFLWERRWPFQYWGNRLEKINIYNDHDKLEAFYCLITLTDVYSHLFAAYARNPQQPWFYVKQETFRKDIDTVLDSIRTDGIPMVGSLVEEPDGLVQIDFEEEYDVDEFDAIAIGLLGCPVEVDPASSTVEFLEPPELHRGTCNSILDFAEKNTGILNDFKHGFRIIPLSTTDLTQLAETIIRFREEDQEQYEATLEELEEEMEEDIWSFIFARMYTESTEYGYDCQIDVYHVDAWSCYKFAELTLNALYNLVTPRSGRYLEEILAEIPELAVEGEVSIMDHILGFSTPMREDPDTVVPEDEYRSE